MGFGSIRKGSDEESCFPHKLLTLRALSHLLHQLCLPQARVYSGGEMFVCPWGRASHKSHSSVLPFATFSPLPFSFHPAPAIGAPSVPGDRSPAAEQGPLRPSLLPRARVPVLAPRPGCVPTQEPEQLLHVTAAGRAKRGTGCEVTSCAGMEGMVWDCSAGGKGEFHPQFLLLFVLCKEERKPLGKAC